MADQAKNHTSKNPARTIRKVLVILKYETIGYMLDDDTNLIFFTSDSSSTSSRDQKLLAFKFL